MTKQEQILQDLQTLFPIGSRFFAIGMDESFTVSEFHSRGLIAWADHDAQTRDRGLSPAFPTTFDWGYMLDRSRVLEEWDSLSVAECKAISEKHFGIQPEDK